MGDVGKVQTKKTVTFGEQINPSSAIRQNSPSDKLGLDVGTMNVVGAKLIDETSGKMDISSLRNVYIKIEPKAEGMLKMRKTPYFKTSKDLVILGDQALDLSSVFNFPMKRTLSKGTITVDETDAPIILKEIFKNVVGLGKDTPIYYSVPAKAIEETKDVQYHREVLRRVLSELGFIPKPFNESFAIVVKDAAQNDFSAIAISYGAGMCNVAMGYQALPILEFSLNRGGDYIDEKVAESLGITNAKVTQIKESPEANLFKFKGTQYEREIEAILYYYKFLISYSIKNFIQQFNSSVTAKKYDFSQISIPIILSGGTSKISGFIDIWKQEFDKLKDEFPIKISDIVPASDPLTVVAEGLAVACSLDL